MRSSISAVTSETARLNDVTDRVHALTMTLYPEQTPFFGPPPVPVHYDGDMTWNIALFEKGRLNPAVRFFLARHACDPIDAADPHPADASQLQNVIENNECHEGEEKHHADLL
jgi:hypothetical protein